MNYKLAYIAMNTTIMREIDDSTPDAPASLLQNSE